MGIFDKMFGRGATAAQERPNAQQRFDQLKQKYQSVLNALDPQHIRLQNLHVQDDKLFIRGTAPTEDAKNRMWDEIRRVNPAADDINADFTVVPDASTPAAGQSYTVKPGDTLSKISKQFYGDANEYMRIFYANRERIKDPDKINVGWTLNIPPDTDN
jgi:hypothetical protein